LMLASTVQFSRYGRAGPGSSRARRRREMSSNNITQRQESFDVGRSPSIAGAWVLRRCLGRPEVRATIARSLRTQQRA